MAKKPQTPAYEAALRELETILSNLESGQTDLADLQAKVERARELLIHCRGRLRDISNTIEKLSPGAPEEDEHVGA